MKTSECRLPGVFVVEASPFADHRGKFQRVFCDQELQDVIGARSIVQINHSQTASVGAVRGMHYQRAPHAEMKLIRCLKGRVWDVAVDLRAGSPTFLQWHAEELSFDNNKMFVIPEGCAHGFQVLEENSELLYLHTARYTTDAEGGVRYNDPMLQIAWPLPITDTSRRDESHPLLSATFPGLSV
ncbi:dTDP-4-dehydrorhamnose 3,5-epimerase [Robbsia andropogonis]|uniref:dTDP-4-dehydrorhamnose 3,5-epimerase n=1 Tax=Robbsia andropogonis TaxID=28092 RepID=UPI002A6AAA7D|nr:dTDP-4-dehydrorhamnose 3,5-epimerase [Robbsia andropogonis]